MHQDDTARSPGLSHFRGTSGMQLNADDVAALYTDASNTDALLSWNGDGPLYAAILDGIFAQDRRNDAAKQLDARYSEPAFTKRGDVDTSPPKPPRKAPYAGIRVTA